MYSTLADLHLWDRALYAAEMVTAESLEEAFTSGKTRWGWRTSYGFGFRLRERNNQKLVYHHGLWNGFRTSFLRYVEDSTTIVVLNHTNSRAKHTLTNKLESIVKNHKTVNRGIKVVNAALSKDFLSSVKLYDKLETAGKIDTEFPGDLYTLHSWLIKHEKPTSAERITDLYSHVTGQELTPAELPLTASVSVTDTN